MNISSEDKFTYIEENIPSLLENFGKILSETKGGRNIENIFVKEIKPSFSHEPVRYAVIRYKNGTSAEIDITYESAVSAICSICEYICGIYRLSSNE